MPRTLVAVPSIAGRHLHSAARYSSIHGTVRWTLPAEAVGPCRARRWYSTHPDMPTLNMGGRGLDAVVDVEKMRQVDTEGVKHIWIEHHRTKECLSGVVPQELFTKLSERTLKWCGRDAMIAGPRASSDCDARTCSPHCARTCSPHYAAP